MYAFIRANRVALVIIEPTGPRGLNSPAGLRANASTSGVKFIERFRGEPQANRSGLGSRTTHPAVMCGKVGRTGLVWCHSPQPVAERSPDA